MQLLGMEKAQRERLMLGDKTVHHIFTAHLRHHCSTNGAQYSPSCNSGRILFKQTLDQVCNSRLQTVFWEGKRTKEKEKGTFSSLPRSFPGLGRPGACQHTQGRSNGPCNVVLASQPNLADIGRSWPRKFENPVYIGLIAS